MRKMQQAGPGGMQEMMRAMMQGQGMGGADMPDMEEMQRKSFV